MKILIFLILFLPLIGFSKTAVHIGENEVLFLEQGVGEFTLEERANAIEARLKNLVKSRQFEEAKLTVRELENVSSVSYGDRILVSITDLDAKLSNQPRNVLAATYKDKIAKAIIAERGSKSLKKIALSVIYALFSTIFLITLLVFISKFFPGLVSTLERWSTKFIPSIRIGTYEMLPASRLVALLVWISKLARLAITLLLIYFYLPLVFSFFPATSHWASMLFGYIANPISQISKVVVGFIPNLFFIAVIIIFTNYLLTFLTFIFKEIERGSIKFPGFYADWAMPTYKLVRFLVLAFSVIVIFPYLPGAGSPAFQGVSVFLGVLFSLGSSSAIASIVSGIVLTYMRPFKVGDRVKISDTVGDIVAKTLLVTRVRTAKNVDITIPNAMVLGSHLINYSSSAKETGLILHTTVTIGYDVDWRLVHKLLIQAVKEVNGILSKPEPFVLQTSLDDFYVSYEINAFTDVPNKMAATYSEIHKNIQEEFSKAGVEIMSPHFSAVRDGSQINIPIPEGAPPKYVPAIRVEKSDLT